MFLRRILLNLIRYAPQQLPLVFRKCEVVTGFHERLTKEFKLSSWQANDIILNVPEEEINRTLYDIKLKILDNNVRNLGGFAAQIFENKYKLGFNKGDRN